MVGSNEKLRIVLMFVVVRKLVKVGRLLMFVLRFLGADGVWSCNM